MARPTKSSFAKSSMQKSNKRRPSEKSAKVNARFFAKFRHNKNSNKLPRDVGVSTSAMLLSSQDELKFEVGGHNKITHKTLLRDVGAIPRRTNVDKDPVHGGKFDNNRDPTSGKVFLVQEKFIN